MTNITFSTCFYNVKSKFNSTIYLEWIQNIISIVNNFNLVIYTDQHSLKIFANKLTKNNPKIIIIIKPFEEFYNYKYAMNWIENHRKSNHILHKHIDWRLNMIWSEKVFMVNETIKNNYFDTELYGWIDIGYFRNRVIDLNTIHLGQWPNTSKLGELDNCLIHYGCVQNNIIYYTKMANEIRSHYQHKMVSPPTTKYNELCFAGGCFILNKCLIDIYTKLYDEKLQYYFSNKYLIKDDQTIIQDMIFNNPDLFYIHMENDSRFENWFMFQRILC